MCGILGQINFKNKRIDKIEFNAALELRNIEVQIVVIFILVITLLSGIGVFQLLI